MKKIRLAVIYGGVSGEHEISLLSARSVIAALDPKKYDVTPLRIEKSGRWTADPSFLLPAAKKSLKRGERSLAPSRGKALTTNDGRGA